MDESDEQLRQWLGTRDAELFFAERRRRVVKSPRWIGTAAAYLTVFCAASLMLCFVLWVASCTLKAMKGVSGL